jgi:hypothetical protein
MPVNLPGGRRTVVYAKVTTPIANTPISATNTRIIFLIDVVEVSHVPDRDLNGFSDLVAGKGYLFDSIIDQDLSNYFAPPFSSGNAILWEDGNTITPE